MKIITRSILFILQLVLLDLVACKEDGEEPTKENPTVDTLKKTVGEFISQTVDKSRKFINDLKKTGEDSRKTDEKPTSQKADEKKPTPQKAEDPKEAKGLDSYVNKPSKVEPDQEVKKEGSKILRFLSKICSNIAAAFKFVWDGTLGRLGKRLFGTQK